MPFPSITALKSRFAISEMTARDRPPSEPQIYRQAFRTCPPLLGNLGCLWKRQPEHSDHTATQHEICLSPLRAGFALPQNLRQGLKARSYFLRAGQDLKPVGTQSGLRWP